MNASEPHPPATPNPPISSSADARPQAALIQRGAFDPPFNPGPLGRLDRFEIIRLLGEGGMGQVYLARDPVTDTHVAVKILKPQAAVDPRSAHRFLIEARHMCRLSHPRILRVLEVSDRKEGPYYVMPYIAGGNLLTQCKPGEPMPTERILTIARQVAEALAHAHAHGLIHRDLKPGNILLDKEGNAFLTDFGLVRSVFNDSMMDGDASHLEGTAPYMSPAVARGEAEDTRCDIYAFGAVLYELLAGQPPYTGRTPKLILAQIIQGSPPPIRTVNPKANPALVRIAEGCMARELRDRYASMVDVVADLDHAAKGGMPLGPHQQFRRSYRIAALLIGALVMAGVIGLVALGISRWSGNPSAFMNPVNINPPPIQPSAGEHAPRPLGCLARYPLEGNAQDVSGGGHHGSVVSVRPTTDRFGKVGGACLFDGKSSRIALASLALPKSSITVSAWAQLDEGAAPGKNYTLVSSSRTTGNSIGIETDGHWIWLINIDGLSYKIQSDKLAARGRWQHLVGVYDGHNADLYVDAVRQRCTVQLDGQITDSPLPLTLGADPEPDHAAIQHFPGAIDDVEIFNRGLTLAEVQQVFHGDLRTQEGPAGSSPTAIPQDPFTFTTNNGTITVARYAGAGGDITIPSATNGLSVTEIGENAFENCTNLTGAAIPGSVTGIAARAFWGCENLTNIVIPEGVTSIGGNAFVLCSKLNSITVDAANTAYSSSADGVLFNKEKTLLVCYPPGKIGEYETPDGITGIGEAAFKLNTNLTSITIADRVTDIGRAAFAGCDGLTSVYFRGDAPSLGDEAFEGASKATIFYRPGAPGWGGEFCARPTALWNPQTTKGDSPDAPSQTWVQNGLVDVRRDGVFGFPQAEAQLLCDGQDLRVSVWNDARHLMVQAIIWGDGDDSLDEMEHSMVMSDNSYLFLDVDADQKATPNIDCNYWLSFRHKSRGLRREEVLSERTSTGFGPHSSTGRGSIRYVAMDNGGRLRVDTYAIPLDEIGKRPGEEIRLVYWAFSPNPRMTLNSVGYKGDYGSLPKEEYAAVLLAERTNQIDVKCIPDGREKYLPEAAASVVVPVIAMSASAPAISTASAATGPNAFVYTATTDGTITLDKYTGEGGVVTIPDTLGGLPVTRIGDAAFLDCAGVTEIKIPASINSIGRRSLLAGRRFVSILVDAQNPVYSSSADGVLFDREKTSLICYPRGKAGSYVIPPGVTRIGWGAFWGCADLARIKIPDSVTIIESNAFRSCTGLTDVKIPMSVTSLDGSSFLHCGGQISITVDAANPVYCSSADNVVFDKGKTTIVIYLNGESKDSDYEIPNSVTAIGSRAFEGCYLTQITIPDSVTWIGERAFADCIFLTNVVVGSRVTDIGTSAFVACAALTQITIPDSVTRIGDWAFSECANLSRIDLPASVVNLSVNAFIYRSGLTSIVVNADNPAYSSSPDGILFNKDGTRLVCYPGGKQGSYTVPESVTEIGLCAFQGCRKITEIVLPTNVTSIGNYAFFDCSGLTGVTLPAMLTHIGDEAFVACDALTGVYFEGNAPQLGNAAFRGATQATVYYRPGTTGWDKEFGGRPTAVWDPQATNVSPPVTTAPVAAKSAKSVNALQVGDPAPELQQGLYVQGEPVAHLETGTVYVVAFWATWCRPCREAIPHLNQLQEKYKDQGLVVIGQDVWEDAAGLEEKVTQCVEKMGSNMTYRVALDRMETKTGTMSESWWRAAGCNRIPTAFVVNQAGQIAWIGHPLSGLDDVVEKVLAGTYDIEKVKMAQAEQKASAANAPLGRADAEDWSELAKAIAANPQEPELPDDGLLARFSFRDSFADTSGANAVFEAKWTEFVGGALYLNGIYEGADSPIPGYSAWTKIPDLSCSRFAIALQYWPIDYSRRNAIFMFGGIGRWFGVEADSEGSLTLTTNSRWQRFPLGVKVAARQWHSLVCSVDLERKRIMVSCDGKRLPDIQLPVDFKFEIVGSAYEKVAKDVGFTNRGTGDVFHGFVANLRVYARALEAHEMPGRQ